MPYKPKHPCGKRDCPNLVEAGERFCTEHKKEYDREYNKTRPSTTERGYDARWQRYRKKFLRDHPYCINANNPKAPWCGVIANIVDHKIPAKGKHDPMFWNPDNHQPMCAGCHNRKTVKDGRWGKK